MDKIIREFIFLHIKNDNFTRSKGERLYNDILEVDYENGEKEYRIYLNNTPRYVSIKYNDDNVMINGLSHYTWTWDNTSFVKSEYDDKTLSKEIERYGLNKSKDLEVKKIAQNDIKESAEYEYKRKEFKKIYIRED